MFDAQTEVLHVGHNSAAPAQELLEVFWLVDRRFRPFEGSGVFC